MPISFSEPQFSMDHRVKPGGDEECCKTRTRKKVRAARMIDLILRSPAHQRRASKDASSGSLACILRGSPDKSGSHLRMR
jgi:hypothetical protein